MGIITLTPLMNGYRTKKNPPDRSSGFKLGWWAYQTAVAL
jgi:hypothetical protein